MPQFCLSNTLMFVVLIGASYIQTHTGRLAVEDIVKIKAVNEAYVSA